MTKEKKSQAERLLNGLKAIAQSIRTRYSLATGLFLLFVLLLFYVGGRVVLIHMMRDTEERVKSVWMDVSGLVREAANELCSRAEEAAHHALVFLPSDCTTRDLLGILSRVHIAFVADCSDDEDFLTCSMLDDGQLISVSPNELSAYRERFVSWREVVLSGKEGVVRNGLLKVRNQPFCVVLVKAPDSSRVFAVGAPFDLSNLSGRVNATFSGVHVNVAKPHVGEKSDEADDSAHSSLVSEEISFAVAPMISEAMSYYTGGFWEINTRALDASFAIRDITGRPIATISISVPQTLAAVASSALGRLSFFIAVIGIFLIFPVFWFQGRMLLNPLTKMTKSILKLSETMLDTDCPRLEWKGKDEFAYLAASVNRMLETISSRTIALAQLESRQRALINGVPDALVVFDSSGRLISISKKLDETKPLPGFEIGEVLSDKVYTEGEISLFQAQLVIVATTGETTNMRLCAQAPDTLEAQHFELRMSQMDQHFILGILRDVTEEVTEHRLRVAAEQHAMDASKRESIALLSAGIAHDVNNVLAVIQNTVEASVADESCRQSVRDAVKRGASMTRELMTVAGETKISLARAKPANVVRDVQSLAAGVAGQNIELIYNLSDDLPDVDVDPNQFWKVFFNIVKNASEAIGSHPGRISITTKAFEMTPDETSRFSAEHALRAGHGVLFCVTDDGPGIPPALLNRLFDPYVSSKSSGRGLGLATVRAIVDAHGGGIRVTSVVGRGTTFDIYLPVSRLPLAKNGEAASAPAVMPTDVLVIDDDEAILQTSAILLKTLGVTPHRAKDRSEALSVFRRHVASIGAILLDANLGGFNTVRLLSAIRMIHPEVRVIVSSGASEEDVRKMFATMPFEVFLTKPWTLTELKTALRGGSASNDKSAQA